MRILVTGAKGMLGRTLVRKLGASLLTVLNQGNLQFSSVARGTDNFEIIGCDIDDFDICCADSTKEFFDEVRPQVVVHCAAMTNVDGCESDFEGAMRVNAIGTGNVANNVNCLGARLLAVSTDYVFDGKLDRPYSEFDETDPVTVYGKSKLCGEEAIRGHCPNHAIQ